MTVYEKINWSSKYKNTYEKVKSSWALKSELSPKRLNVKIIVRSPDVIENDLFIVSVFLCNFVLCFPVGVEHFAVVAKPNFAWGIRLSM